LPKQHHGFSKFWELLTLVMLKSKKLQQFIIANYEGLFLAKTGTD